MKYSEYEKAFSPARLNKYLVAYGGNTAKALTLYRFYHCQNRSIEMKKWQKILSGTTLAALVCVELLLFGIYYGVITGALWELHLQSNYPIDSPTFAINVISIMM